MKVPRDVSGDDFIKVLARFGYRVTRRKSSHIRLMTAQNGKHSVTVPDHSPIRIGTLTAILKDIADHLEIDRDEILKLLAD